MLVRVSDIDAFRRWREDPESELGDLLANLRRETPASEAMLAGTAFHAALETVQPGEVDRLEAQGYTFLIDADADLAISEIRELRAGKDYVMPDGYVVTVSGQVDALQGKRVEDHKTTGQMDAERFFTGYQWRFYLDIHDATTFRWNVFELAPASERRIEEMRKRGEVVPDGPVYVVRSCHRLEQYRYPEMQADCQALVEAFYAFARVHLPERIAQEAA
ncbi:hypothetical protein [Coralloluteibacterium thermophilus]|uniref:Uncharacterized protein n=1 Tax=Coralloluteibacterium thermophilum TaxID=2707049 RepID=A0ABV9NFG9_9GAMM